MNAVSASQDHRAVFTIVIIHVRVCMYACMYACKWYVKVYLCLLTALFVRQDLDESSDDYVHPNEADQNSRIVPLQSFSRDLGLGRRRKYSKDSRLGLTKAHVVSNTDHTAFNGHSKRILGLCTDSKRYAATVGVDKSIVVWDLEKSNWVNTLVGDAKSIICVAYLDENRLLSGGASQDIYMWDPRSGKVVSRLTGHTASVTSMLVMEDRSRFISASRDGSIITWDATHLEMITEFVCDTRSPVRCLAIVSNDVIASGHDCGSLRLWSMSENAMISTVQQAHTSEILCLLAVDQALFTGGSDCSVYRWEISNRMCKKSLAIEGHSDCVSGLVNLDSELAASGSHDGCIRIWKKRDGYCVKVLDGHEDYISGLCTFRNKSLISIGFDNTMRLWPLDDFLHLNKEDQSRSTSSTDRTKIHHAKLFKQLELGEEDTLTLDGALGSGHFGTVLKGTLLRVRGHVPLDRAQQARECAVKKSDQAQGHQSLQKEIEIYRHILRYGVHKHVLEMYGYVNSPKNVQLVLSFATRGSLLACLRHSRGPPRLLSGRQMMKFALEIALGMEHLAVHRIVHGDLAARNILLHGDGRMCKISDFGLAQVIPQGAKRVNFATSAPVAWKWVAIETLRNGVASVKTDVWSFGVILAEIVTFGAKPYPGIANEDLLALLDGGECTSMWVRDSA